MSYFCNLELVLSCKMENITHASTKFLDLQMHRNGITLEHDSLPKLVLILVVQIGARLSLPHLRYMLTL